MDDGEELILNDDICVLRSRKKIPGHRAIIRVCSKTDSIMLLSSVNQGYGKWIFSTEYFPVTDHVFSLRASRELF